MKHPVSRTNATIVAVAIILTLSGCPSLGETVRTDSPKTETRLNTSSSTQTVPGTGVPTTAPTPTAVDTVTATARPHTTSTVQTSTNIQPTESPTETDRSFREFAVEFNSALERYSLVPTEVLAYGNRNGTWYVVVNSTAPSVNQSVHDAQWTNTARAYAHTIRKIKQSDNQTVMPSRMMLLDWNSSTYQLTPGTYTVKTRWAQALVNENITIEEYGNRWQNTIRTQTKREQRIAKEFNRQAENKTYHKTSGD